MDSTIPAEVLDRTVAGVNLMPGSLRDQVGDEETLLVFLRHFGCIFCRETLVDLRQASESAADFPRVLFFFQGTPTEGRVFLPRYWPGARAVSDPERRFYTAFGIERAGLRTMLTPALWSAERRARQKGLANGRAAGDIWMMPGLFLVRGERILWTHDFRHPGDHPEFARIPELASLSGAA